VGRKEPPRIYWRASLMPAVAVTSAPEAYTYIVALRGFSVGRIARVVLILSALPSTSTVSAGKEQSTEFKLRPPIHL